MPYKFLTSRKARLPEPPVNADLDRGFVFIHIPKNAGTAVYRALGLPKSDHFFLSDYKRILGEREYKRLYKFCFVRNPYDRFVSLYKYAKLTVSYYHNNLEPKKAIYGAHLDYPLLKTASLRECAQHLVEGRLRHNEPRTMWLPQSRWLENDGMLQKIEFIGRFENIDKDFATIAEKLGIGECLRKLNQSEALPVELDHDTKNLLADYYADDFLNFGYPR